LIVTRVQAVGLGHSSAEPRTCRRCAVAVIVAIGTAVDTWCSTSSTGTPRLLVQE
jgi:hypothetical protein